MNFATLLRSCRFFRMILCTVSLLRPTLAAICLTFKVLSRCSSACTVWTFAAVLLDRGCPVLGWSVMWLLFLLKNRAHLEMLRAERACAPKAVFTMFTISRLDSSGFTQNSMQMRCFSLTISLRSTFITLWFEYRKVSIAQKSGNVSQKTWHLSVCSALSWLPILCNRSRFGRLCMVKNDRGQNICDKLSYVDKCPQIRELLFRLHDSTDCQTRMSWPEAEVDSTFLWDSFWDLSSEKDPCELSNSPNKSSSKKEQVSPVVVAQTRPSWMALHFLNYFILSGPKTLSAFTAWEKFWWFMSWAVLQSFKFRVNVWQKRLLD